MNPPSLPPVPPPAVAAAPVPGMRLPTRPSAAPFKTLFDSPPLDTLKARASAEKARQAMSAAVKAARAALEAANEAAALGKEAAALLAAEGLPPDVLKTFTKTAGPLVDAFGVAPTPETPPPAA